MKVLFINEEPIVIVTGKATEAKLKKILKKEATDYYEAKKCHGSWKDRETFDRQKHWYYMEVREVK